MRVGQGPTNLGGRLGRQVTCALFMGFVVLSMGMRDCEEGDTGFVTITSPDAGTVFTSAETVTIEATVLDELLGDVSKVEFYDGTTDISPACTDGDGPQYQCAWAVTGAENGTHSWTARAYFRNGKTIDSKTVELTVDITAGTRGNPPGARGLGLVGFMPGLGTVMDVAVRGQEAFVASGDFGLSITDARGPNAELLAVADAPFHGRAVAVNGNRAVVLGEAADGMARLWTLDLAGEPVVAGELPIQVPASNIGEVMITPDGTRAVAALGFGISVFDVTDLASPRLLGSASSSGVALGLALDSTGRWAYVAAGTADLEIFDLANPASPQLAGSLALSGYHVSVAASNGSAYLLSSQGSIRAVDVSRPNAPVLTGIVYAGGVGTHLAAEGNTLVALVNTSAGRQIRLFDASGDRDPIEIGSAIAHVEARRVRLIGGRIFVAAGPAGLQIFEGPASAPRLEATVEDDFHGYETAAASGRAAVLGWDLGSGNAVLRVFDVDSAGKPTPVGELDTGLTAGNIQDLEMAVDGSYAVAALGPHGIWVIALVGTGAPRLLGTYDTPGVAMDVVLDSSGSIAFVADGSAGLQILDVTNPAEPHLVGSKRLSGFEKSVAVVGQTAYLVSSQGTLEGVDVSDPANPLRFGWAVAGGIGVHMAGLMTPEGPRLAILVGAGGIHLNIFDATPRNPTLMGTVFVEDARRVAMVGDKAFVADVTEGFKIFSIEGGNPILMESDIAPGRAEDVDVHGTTAYVTGFPSSLSVVEIEP